MSERITTHATENLTYEIREIVKTAKRFEDLGQEIIWENIGDPVAKGESVPAWVKKLTRDSAGKDAAYAYGPTKGLHATRRFLAESRNAQTGPTLRSENIIFFNGLGDAVSHLYRALKPDVRIIGPDPAYPTHAIAEAEHADKPSLTYRLNPNNGWQIDLTDLEQKLEENPAIRGILLINPGNPTGKLFDRESLAGVVALAQEYDCLLISDEIYHGIDFADTPHPQLRELVEAVPLVVLRGLSKVVPWPGARCGWMEFYNAEEKPLEGLRDRIFSVKLREVCATTLPQLVLPEIFSDKRFGAELNRRSAAYHVRAQLLTQALSDIPGVSVCEPDSAYYASITFSKMPEAAAAQPVVADLKRGELFRELTEEASFDEGFCYYLLATEGICVVPLSSGFFSETAGFRMTLLEPDLQRFKQILNQLRRALVRYLQVE